jgi:hypothetical protein
MRCWAILRGTSIVPLLMSLAKNELEPVSKIIFKAKNRIFRPRALKDDEEYLDISRSPEGHGGRKRRFWSRERIFEMGSG